MNRAGVFVRRVFCMSLLSALSFVSVTAQAGSALDDRSALSVATHRQASTIKVNMPGHPDVKLTSFCLTADDEILAGCAGEKGEIRVLSTDGKLVKSFLLPIKPEAISSRADGCIFVAGEGKLLKLSSDGKVELNIEAPQAAALKDHPEKLKEEVISQAKESAKQFKEQSATYDKMIDQADKQIKSANDQIASLEKAEEGQTEDKDAAADKKAALSKKRSAASKVSLEQRVKMYERQKKQYEDAKAQFAQILGTNTTGELSDAEIDQQVKSSIEYKLKASSISALGNEVFFATHAFAGYGFEVWKMDDKFENPTKVVNDLSGCCGQMDVKASKDGLFVAENSQHRVRRFDLEGKPILAWGESARTGIEGFGSCCNPMNVAFGPTDSVYTAEDDTGRIKKYSVDGKLLGLVGSVELKPGCKNCAIAVSSDGSKVYMVDITRNFIVELSARPKDEVTADAQKEKSNPTTKSPDSGAGASLIFDALKLIYAAER